MSTIKIKLKSSCEKFRNDCLGFIFLFYLKEPVILMIVEFNFNELKYIPN